MISIPHILQSGVEYALLTLLLILAGKELLRFYFACKCNYMAQLETVLTRNSER